jgi:hypothetical protein
MNFAKIREISHALASKHASDQRCRHFSFIMHKKRVLSIGFNTPKTHPINLKYDFVNKKNVPIHDLVGTHSELSAVIKLGTENCEGLIMVNTRVNRRNEIDFSMPCRGCQSFLDTLNFKKIYYSDKSGNFLQLV